MRATILDYGVGNLFSLAAAFAAVEVPAVVEPDLDSALASDCLVLPGVGGFPVAASRLAAARLVLRERLQRGLPCLAICLGMQLLLERSAEGPGSGLGLVAGGVTRLNARRVPHMGWNRIESDDALFVESGLRTAYFAHGFACRPADASTVLAWTTHGSDRFPAALRAGQTVGVQFHPEKSSRAGLAFLRAYWRSVTA